MRRITIIFICLYSLTTEAQSKHELNLNIGGTIPIGNYASTNLSDYKSNAASIGFSANIEYTYYILKYMGFSSMIGVSVNPVDIKSIEGYYNNLVVNIVQMQNLKINPYSKYSFMIGIKSKIPLFKSICLIPSAFIGIVQINKGNESFISTIGRREFNYNGKSEQSIGYQFGISCQYDYTKKWNLIAGINYNYAKLSLDNHTTVLKTTNNLNFPLSVNTTTINPSLGIGYKF